MDLSHYISVGQQAGVKPCSLKNQNYFLLHRGFAGIGTAQIGFLVSFYRVCILAQVGTQFQVFEDGHAGRGFDRGRGSVPIR